MGRRRLGKDYTGGCQGGETRAGKVEHGRFCHTDMRAKVEGQSIGGKLSGPNATPQTICLDTGSTTTFID